VADYVKLDGVAASEGVGLGPAFVHIPHELKLERESISKDTVEDELKRFKNAIEAVVRELSETMERLREGGGESEAGIFEAHAEMAEDPELQEDVEERVRNLESPEAAVLAVGEEYAETFAAMEDEYLSARADDVRDVASQIAAELTGGKKAGLETLTEPSVVLARNLAPSDTARIPKGMALGFVISEGSRTSHVSIMARSFGIPAVVGVGGALEEALEAEIVAVDGTEGYAIADPDPDMISQFEQKQRDIAAEAALLEEYKHAEARSSDGRRIEVSANLG
jgi:phosphoenolpyruvate-protein kinase (PTS system EI component)